MPVAAAASVTFGASTVTPSNSAMLRGFGSAVTIGAARTASISSRVKSPFA